MTLTISRIILFTAQMKVMVGFYRDRLGLEQIADEPGWQEFAAGACRIALHRGSGSPGAKAPKIVFFAADVAATRADLVARGVALGKIRSVGGLDLCDGKDPDGNPFQVSNRA